MEYLCHYCKDFFDATYCESHFEGIHNQQGITFEKLKERMDVLGGLITREEPESSEPPKTPKIKNWLFKDKNDPTNNGVLITNNFRHDMK